MPKVRTMRVTLYDAGGKKIDSRDIVITLAYLDDKVAEPISSTGSLASLTDADKIILESLKDLVRTIAPEGQRVKFMQYINQIQENWSDVTAKTKTIIDFQQAVAELSLSETDKNKFLTNLDSLLLSDSETKDDVSLAASVLRKLVPSTNIHYKEIFGDDGKGGLVGEIMSHPTNTALNKELATKIMGYILEDKNISDADKVILKEQLKVIIAGGTKNLAIIDSPVEESQSTGGLLLGILKAFGIILVIIFGGIAIIYVIYKMTKTNNALTFQDFIIERFALGGASRAPVVKPTSVVPSSVVESPVQLVDPLASVPNTPESRPSMVMSDPLAEVVPARELTPEAETEVAIPDWLRAATESRNTDTPETSPTPELSQDVPEVQDTSDTSSSSPFD